MALGGKIGSSINECYSLKDSGKWIKIEAMNNNRRFSASVSTESLGLVVIGGESDSKARHSSVEFLMGDTWKELSSAKLKISRHCAVSINDEEIYIIGGNLEDQPFSKNVFVLNMPAGDISPVKGSSIKHGRQFHSCAKVGKDRIIVAGGRNYQGLLRSVEVFNLRTLRWTEPIHIQLKDVISHAQFISSLAGFLNIYAFKSIHIFRSKPTLVQMKGYILFATLRQCEIVKNEMLRKK